MKATLPPKVADLLGESLLRCPVTGSRIMGPSEFHQLMDLTRGTVFLRGRDWRIVPRRHGRRLVHVTLRVEP